MLNVDRLSIPRILHDISFGLEPGERLGIVGESGSGKSMTALAVMGLLPTNLQASGKITVAGTEMLTASEKKLNTIRGRRVAMVFQEPMTALDPMMQVGRQVAAANRDADIEALFAEVGLAGRLNAYPHELSGGQRQRVLIAKAIAADPDILICDEPTTALDVTAQAQILALIKRLVAERNMGLIFISHDLAVISQMCEKILVMRAGQVIERGPTSAVLTEPTHDYTAALVSAARPGPPAPRAQHGDPIITISDVSTEHILTNVSLTVRAGERLGIVGGSGSGKTTLLRLIAGLAAPTQGSVLVDGSVHVVFQDPKSSLNPKLTIKTSIAEGGPRVTESLAEVGLPPESAERYPHEFSGGQRQRIAIARAIAGRPDILLADEPVSALDMTVRSQVLDVLTNLTDQHGLTLIFVSHDLSVVRQLCDKVAVINQGQIVEYGWTEEVWANPQHAYTQQLLAAIHTV